MPRFAFILLPEESLQQWSKILTRMTIPSFVSQVSLPGWIGRQSLNFSCTMKMVCPKRIKSRNSGSEKQRKPSFDHGTFGAEFFMGTTSKVVGGYESPPIVDVHQGVQPIQIHIFFRFWDKPLCIALTCPKSSRLKTIRPEPANSTHIFLMSSCNFNPSSCFSPLCWPVPQTNLKKG